MRFAGDWDFPLRHLLLPAFLLCLASACASSSEELLPIPHSIKGASLVQAVEVAAAPAAARSVAGSDAKAGGATLSQLLERSIIEETRAAGLISGRALRLKVEIDAIQTADAASAFVGKDDRLEGSVYVRDAATGESLGHLYIDIGRANGGLLNALARGGNIRESLVRQFASEVAAALGGRPRTR